MFGFTRFALRSSLHPQPPASVTMTSFILGEQNSSILYSSRPPLPAASLFFPGSAVNAFNELFLPLCTSNSALEKWLTNYQILHLKGPILGFCSGHPVYPQTCVQMLHTKERWLREGLQLKVNELPVKVLNCSVKLSKVKFPEADENDESGCVGPGATINLYGKWQTEPLCLPHAVNGIVPKNECGQVDVWSEKCLPPGTIHLRLPIVFSIAKRLEIDYAPAMV